MSNPRFTSKTAWFLKDEVAETIPKFYRRARVNWYILNENKEPVLCENWLDGARALEESDRRVGSDEVGDVHISTIFLGLDHNWGNGPPILFETMIFGGSQDGFQCRYHTYQEALAGHEETVRMVKEDGQTFADLPAIARHLCLNLSALEYCDFGRAIRYTDTKLWVAQKRDDRWYLCSGKTA